MSRHRSNPYIFIIYLPISLDLQLNCTVWTSCKCSIRDTDALLYLWESAIDLYCAIFHILYSFYPQQCIYNKETVVKRQALAVCQLNHYFICIFFIFQSWLKEHYLVYGYLKSRSQHSTHKTDWIGLWKGLSCRIRRWELFSCWNWLAPGPACSTDIPCDWTPSSETPASQILLVSVWG